MDETRKRVKGLTLKHRREGKLVEEIKKTAVWVKNLVMKPILSDHSKNFKVEYDDIQISGEELDDLPEKRVVQKVVKGQDGQMLEKLKEIYRL